MMQFLAAAMSSIPPDVLCIDIRGNFNLPSVLLEPTRRPLTQTTTLQRMNLLQQIVMVKWMWQTCRILSEVSIVEGQFAVEVTIVLYIVSCTTLDVASITGM